VGYLIPLCPLHEKVRELLTIWPPLLLAGSIEIKKSLPSLDHVFQKRSASNEYCNDGGRGDVPHYQASKEILWFAKISVQFDF
jgi:hypothetical protein